MPPRKKSSSLENETAHPEGSTPDDSDIEPAEKVSSSTPQSSGEQQLFFSTDGDEPERERPNPYEEATEQSGEDPKLMTKPKSEGKDEPNGSIQHPKAQGGAQGGHGPRQPAGNKKQNWQDRKRQKNKQRSKFKRPRKLPYEETETRPLEFGLLLESESLLTEDSVNELASNFASCSEPINLDEFVVLSQLELKEKIAGLGFDVTLPPAPVREELIDLLLDVCLKIGKRLSFPELFKLWRMVMDLSSRKKKITG